MGRKITGWLSLALAVLLLSGCAEVFSGILMEKRRENGSSDRVRVEGLDADAWKQWQPNRSKKYDEMGVILKKETTF
ncbi:MAG: hypothetical protein AB1491_14455 [Thermodesulfobacteriota bacterium]